MMKQFLIFTVMILYSIITNGQTGSNPVLEKHVDVNSRYALELCKHLHKNPELSFLEFETSQRMQDELKQIGFEVTKNFGGNNVIGLFKNGNGPTIMLRTDMDALPIKEKTDFEFASTKESTNRDGDVVPVMHACGHDIHMSVWLGSLRCLVEMKDHWQGTLLVIAQQAEEFSGGAKLAIDTGLFSKFPKPDAALAYHINPELESGKIGLAQGPVFAGVKTAEITVFGKGGHGAYPEKCIDPIVISSRIIMDLQTIISRETNPLDPVVVTVGSIHGGTRPNIIPDEVKMELTLRYYNEAVITKTIEAIKRVCDGAALTAGMPKDKLPNVKVLAVNTPPVINHDNLSSDIQNITTDLLGAENVIAVKPAMVGEDFGVYGTTEEKIPICLMWLGSTSPALMKELNAKGEKPYPLHSPHLNPDYEQTIYTGIKVMTANVLGLMNK